jgi:hypothetical protein
MALRDGSVSRQQNRYGNIRGWGPGERLVFEPYTKEVHTETFAWIARRGIFAETGLGHRGYDDSGLSLEGSGQASK